MAPTKTLRQREKELQALMATPSGRQELSGPSVIVRNRLSGEEGYRECC
jgi:hypothetical protein